MNIDPTSEKPIFLQIAEELEDSIFIGAFQEGEQIPSTTEISAMWKINPHTVLKGMNVLVDEGIIFKKRGLGMFVNEGALKRIQTKRQNNFYEAYIEALLKEADKLNMTKEEIISMIERGYENGSHSH